jgi:hypothetical protein
MASDLTLVSLAAVETRLSARLIFGAPHLIRNSGREGRIAAFKPGDVFGYELKRADYRAAGGWQFHVIQAGSRGNRISRIPGIAPGGILLLSALQHHHARRALEAARMVLEHAEPGMLSPAFWQRVSTQLQAGLPMADLLEREVW